MEGNRSARWIGALLALAGSAWFAHASEAFSLDDAYIHLAYAKSLWLGDGFSYNPGDWELGASSPLWALLLAPLSTLAHVQGAVQLLGALLHAGGAFASGRLAEELGARPLAATLASLLFALHPILLQASISGMEVGLATLLLVLLTLATLRARYLAASALAFAAVLARPESLVFAGVLSLGCAWQRRSRPALAVALAALVAMACWAGYCELVAGYPLPNTFYAKAAFEPVASLKFVALRVLGEEPWLLGLGGAWLIAQRTREPGPWRVCGAAYFVTLLATAAGRLLIWKLLFVQQRYFACLAFVPPVLAAAAVNDARTRSAWLLVPCLLACLLSLPRALARTRAQEHDTRVLHVELARWVNAELAHDTRIAVEGAGALRFFTARTLSVIDVLGLNDRRIVHAGSQLRAVCTAAARRPAYLLLPDRLLPAFSALFESTRVYQVQVAASAHSVVGSSWTVHVLAVRGLRADLVARCQAAIDAR